MRQGCSSSHSPWPSLCRLAAPWARADVAGGGEVRALQPCGAGSREGAWLCHHASGWPSCTLQSRVRRKNKRRSGSGTSPQHFTRIGAFYFLILLLIYYSSQGREVDVPSPFIAMEPGVLCCPQVRMLLSCGQGDVSRNGGVPGGAGTRGKGPRRRGRAEG